MNVKMILSTLAVSGISLGGFSTVCATPAAESSTVASADEVKDATMKVFIVVAKGGG